MMNAQLEAAMPKPCCVCGAQNGRHCAKCKSRHYCSKACQLVDWSEGGHKAQCRQLAAAFQDRMLDEIMPAKKVKEAPPIVEDVAPAAGFKAAARLSAVPTTAHGATLERRGTCAICLDLLPLEGLQQTFYDCCCKTLCKECSTKCRQIDQRCPLCRAPARKSDAEWLRRVQKHVDQGHADAQFMLGQAYHQGMFGLQEDSKRAARLFELAALQGDAGAQSTLGQLYELGLGVEVDHEVAVMWSRRAAEQGSREDQVKLGHACIHGRGMAQSDTAAVKWYRLAAAQGQSDALYNLGACYAIGQGVPQDLYEALRFLKLAAAKGHDEAAEKATGLEAALAAHPY